MDLLSQMATFVRIVDGKSLSAAARAQRLSLPAISRQQRGLEADLGVSLIMRSTRRLHVTDAGQQWYAHCVRVLREVDAARANVSTTNAVRGTLVVSASLTFGTEVIVPQLNALVARHPQLVIDLRLEDHIVDLVAEGVDVAIRAGQPPPDSTAFFAQPIFDMRRVVVAAPRWLRKHGTPREPAQLVRHACRVQVTPAGTTFRWHLRRGDDDQTIDVRGPLRSNAPVALRSLAVDGGGLAYLPDWVVAPELASGRLRRVLPEWSSPPLMAWAIYRAELRSAPRLRAFLDALPSGPIGDAATARPPDAGRAPDGATRSARHDPKRGA
jgi:DNA-binding transcriptional LysR family regulator